MKHIALLLCSSAILFLSCQSTELVELKDDDGKVILRFEVQKGTDIKHGQEESYAEDGTLASISHYKDGNLDGSKIFFDANGDTTIVEHYDQGIFHGEYLSYHEGGGLRQKGQYIDGKMQGDWLKYYANGQLEERVPFVDNNENGDFIEYHENGNLKARGSYKDGDHEHGPLEIFDEAGELIRKMECDMGVCRTIWRKEKDEVINEG